MEEFIGGFAEVRRRYPSAAIVQLPVSRAAVIAPEGQALLARLIGRVNAAAFQGRAPETLLYAFLRLRRKEVPLLLFLHRAEGWNTERASDGNYHRVERDGRPVHALVDFTPLEAWAVEAASEAGQ